MGCAFSSPEDTLLRACARGEVEVVAELLRKRKGRAFASPNIRDGDGFSPLHVAAAAGHVTVVKLLLDKGANPAAVRGVASCNA